MRQHRKLSCFQENRFIHAIDRKPAMAGDQCKTEEAIAWHELEAPITSRVNSARHKAARPEKRNTSESGSAAILDDLDINAESIA